MGKSTVAVQLALAHQLAGHKVLSLDEKIWKENFTIFNLHWTIKLLLGWDLGY